MHLNGQVTVALFNDHVDDPAATRVDRVAIAVVSVNCTDRSLPDIGRKIAAALMGAFRADRFELRTRIPTSASRQEE